jgi:hypothetical protein
MQRMPRSVINLGGSHDGIEMNKIDWGAARGGSSRAFGRYIEVHITDDGIKLMELKLKPDLARTDSESALLGKR